MGSVTRRWLGLARKERAARPAAAAASQPKYSHPTTVKTGSRTAHDHPVKAKKLGIAIPRSTPMA